MSIICLPCARTHNNCPQFLVQSLKWLSQTLQIDRLDPIPTIWKIHRRDTDHTDIGPNCPLGLTKCSNWTITSIITTVTIIKINTQIHLKKRTTNYFMFLYIIVQPNGQNLTFDIYHMQKTDHLKKQSSKSWKTFAKNFDWFHGT